MRRIAVINQKGGVGKTTTTANLGAALAIQGRRVVVVDMDAQANLSLALGVEAEAESPTSYTLLMGSATFAEALRPTKVQNLSLVASHLDLSGAELELASAMGREYLLRDALREWEAAHRAQHGTSPADYVLFDCPPSLGLLSINALAASGEVLITLQTEFLAMQGMSKLVEVVQLLKRRLNPELEIGGILPCLYDSRLVLAREVLGEIRRYFPGLVLERPIRSSVKLAEAPSFGQTIFEYADDSNAADDYRSAALAIVARESRFPELAGMPAFDASKRLRKPASTRVPPPPRPRTKVVQDAAEALARLAAPPAARSASTSTNTNATGIESVAKPSSTAVASPATSREVAIERKSPATLDASDVSARDDTAAQSDTSARHARTIDDVANASSSKARRVAHAKAANAPAKPSETATPSSTTPEALPSTQETAPTRTNAPKAKSHATAATHPVEIFPHAGTSARTASKSKTLAAKGASNERVAPRVRVEREAASTTPSTPAARSERESSTKAEIPNAAPSSDAAASSAPNAEAPQVAKAATSAAKAKSTPPHDALGTKAMSAGVAAVESARSHATTKPNSKPSKSTVDAKAKSTTIEPTSSHATTTANPPHGAVHAKSSAPHVATVQPTNSLTTTSSSSPSAKTHVAKSAASLVATSSNAVNAAAITTPRNSVQSEAKTSTERATQRVDENVRANDTATKAVAPAAARANAPLVAKSASAAPKAARTARASKSPAKPASKVRGARPSSPARALAPAPIDDLPPLPPDAFEILSLGS